MSRAPVISATRLGQLGLAGAGRALDQDRLAEPVGQEHDAGDALVGEVVHVSQPVANLLNALETVTHGLAPYRPT